MSEENEVETDDTMSALAAAWDAAETDDGTEQQGNTVSEPSGESSDTTDTATGDTGAKQPDINEKWLRRGEDDADSLDSQSKEGQGDLGTPPAGISLEAREAWNEVPDVVKQDIVRREQDYAAGIEKHRQNAQRAEAMDRSLQPYQQLFQMNGGAKEFMPNLLQTASLLQMGTPQQKAEMAANIIKQFGVDIKALDSVLVGEAPSQEMQAQNHVQQMINQQLGPMQQQLQQYQQRDQYAQQQSQQQVAQEVTDFGASHEFYNDVRSQMADFLDMAANRGQPMDMEQAYNLACSSHPQISKIMNGRQSQASVDQKRQAASSIQGGPGGTMGGSAPNSVAAALNDAWDSAGRM